MKKLISLVLVALLALLPCAASADELTDLIEILQRQRKLSVSGSALIRVYPDCAYLHFGAETYDLNSESAVKDNIEIIEAFLDVVHDFGLTDDEIILGQQSTAAIYSTPENSTTPPRIRGYRVNHGVTVYVYDITIIDELVKKAVDAGITTFDSITYGHTNANDLYDEVLTQAIQEARRKATLMAEANDATLGEVLSIGEGSGTYPGLRQLKIENTVGSPEDFVKWIELMNSTLEFTASVSMTFKLE